MNYCCLKSIIIAGCLNLTKEGYDTNFDGTIISTPGQAPHDAQTAGRTGEYIAGHPADVAGGYERHHGIPSWNLMCSSLSDSLVPEAVFFMTYFQNLYHFCKS